MLHSRSLSLVNVVGRLTVGDLLDIAVGGLDAHAVVLADLDIYTILEGERSVY